MQKILHTIFNIIVQRPRSRSLTQYHRSEVMHDLLQRLARQCGQSS